MKTGLVSASVTAIDETARDRSRSSRGPDRSATRFPLLGGRTEYCREGASCIALRTARPSGLEECRAALPDAGRYAKSSVRQVLFKSIPDRVRTCNLRLRRLQILPCKNAGKSNGDWRIHHSVSFASCCELSHIVANCWGIGGAKG